MPLGDGAERGAALIDRAPQDKYGPVLRWEQRDTAATRLDIQILARYRSASGRSKPKATAVDVGSWLKSLGLGQYEGAFRENAINADLLPALTADDLKDLGITLVGHRRRLLEAIADLRRTAASDQTLVSTSAVSQNPREPADDSEAVAERRPLSVMFCDLIGSTALSAQLDPEDLGEIIRGYQARVATVIRQFDGFIASYVGDGVLPKLLQHAEEAIALSAEHGLSHWYRLGLLARGWAFVTMGQASAALSPLTEALAIARATGVVAGTPQNLIALAESHSTLGHLPEALSALTEAERVIESTGIRHIEPDLHLARASLANRTGDRSAEEANFRRALEVATAQGSKLLELCAATHLAEMLHEQGKGPEAWLLLAPIYSCFTEGFGYARPYRGRDAFGQIAI